MKPLNQEEKEGLKRFFATIVGPILGVVFIVWLNSEIPRGMTDHELLRQAAELGAVVGFLLAVLSVIAGAIYALVWVVSKAWHHGKS